MYKNIIINQNLYRVDVREATWWRIWLTSKQIGLH